MGRNSRDSPGNTTITNYAWTFTSGTPSSLPTNGVPAAGPVNWGAVGPGPHSVTLQVTNNFGDTSALEIKNVTVTAGSPTAIIGSAVDGGNCTVTFLDGSTSPDSSVNNQWSWTFTGGSPAVSSLQNPGVVNYDGTLGPSATTAPVSLTVTNTFSNSNSTGATTVPISGCSP